MVKTSEYWSHQHYLHPFSPNPSLLGRPFGVCQLNNKSISRNPHFVNDSASRIVPSFSVPVLQPLKANEPNNLSNWFHGLPRSQQAFTSALNSTTNFAPVQKKFLVFDQSGDKTTLIFSSGVETSILHGNCYPQKYPTAYDLSKDGPRDSIYDLTPITNREQKEDESRDSTEDEMHEDTEELNALLYSDSDSYFSEDDESTGHSPSIMTDNRMRDLVEEIGEEVDSFAEPTKKRKLLDGGYDVLLHNSLKSRASSVSEDAESSCGHEQIMENLGSSLSSGLKRSKKERIWETVSILQSIIPSVSEKDAIGVIDGAIHYLKSLKVKAKALGLDTL